MGGQWRKVKMALGKNMCLFVPQTLGDSSSPSNNVVSRFSDAVPGSLLVSPAGFNSDCRRPSTPTSSSSGLWASKSGPRSSKKTCTICLTTMKPGQGHAIFTAECSHSFHFHCIASNVKHGNQICPICRAKWKEVPFQSPSSSLSSKTPRINPSALLQISTPFQNEEPGIFDDDEVLDHHSEITERSNSSAGTIEAKMYPEVSAVPQSASHTNFSILVHIKAPFKTETQSNGCGKCSRAPIDLVTVLDTSGSMSGTKLALLKRAMSFLIQNLGPMDRLSVVSFSSMARRLFPLSRMNDTGRQRALQAVNTLCSNGGTNIAEGLRKGAKVLVERKWRNPVASIILLSDGQDTYSVTSPRGAHSRTNYRSLLPVSIHRNNGSGLHIPVHSFGFGADHDAASMHLISEISGGTFSFIEAEAVIQDAFAQCIGGLLSVIVQDLQIGIECLHPKLKLGSIKAGSYLTNITDDLRTGSINVGDLYAEEERDFLVTVNIPTDRSSQEMSLLKVQCMYQDPFTKETATSSEASEVKIQRPKTIGDNVVVSFEVDRQKNRLNAVEAMAEARVLAERGDLRGGVSVLESCRMKLCETSSARAGDQLCVTLCAELKEMQERMENRHVYEASGRAYVLSGLSSHSWQRATARGDSTDSGSLLQAYQTQSMVDMLTRSQTMVIGKPSNRRTLQPAQSFPIRTRRHGN